MKHMIKYVAILITGLVLPAMAAYNPGVVSIVAKVGDKKITKDDPVEIGSLVTFEVDLNPGKDNGNVNVNIYSTKDLNISLETLSKPASDPTVFDGSDSWATSGFAEGPYLCEADFLNHVKAHCFVKLQGWFPVKPATEDAKVTRAPNSRDITVTDLTGYVERGYEKESGTASASGDSVTLSTECASSSYNLNVHGQSAANLSSGRIIKRYEWEWCPNFPTEPVQDKDVAMSIQVAGNASIVLVQTGNDGGDHTNAAAEFSVTAKGNVGNKDIVTVDTVGKDGNKMKLDGHSFINSSTDKVDFEAAVSGKAEATENGGEVSGDAKLKFTEEQNYEGIPGGAKTISLTANISFTGNTAGVRTYSTSYATTAATANNCSNSPQDSSRSEATADITCILTPTH